MPAFRVELKVVRRQSIGFVNNEVAEPYNGSIVARDAFHAIARASAQVATENRLKDGEYVQFVGIRNE